MTIISLIYAIIALVLLILAIGRIQNSPKTSFNLFIALLLGIAVGLNIQNIKKQNNVKNIKTEKCSYINNMPMQALQSSILAKEDFVAYEFTGKANLCNTTYIQGDLQLPIINCILHNIRPDPIIFDSS